MFYVLACSRLLGKSNGVGASSSTTEMSRCTILKTIFCVKNKRNRRVSKTTKPEPQKAFQKIKARSFFKRGLIVKFGHELDTYIQFSDQTYCHDTYVILFRAALTF
jgi:hypothetical protein